MLADPTVSEPISGADAAGSPVALRHFSPMPTRRRSDKRSSRQLTVQSPSPGTFADPEAAFTALEEAMGLARRWRRPLTVFLIEASGSDAPDLPRLSSFLIQTLRDTDAVWPIRQDRLLVILADADAAGATPPLERIRTGLGPEVAGALNLGRVTPPPGIGAHDVLDLAENARVSLSTV